MKKFAIIGYPLQHSFSPKLHNKAFKYLNMEAKYSKIEIKPEEFQNKLLKIKKMDYNGFNVTVPFKEKILLYLDQIEPLAQKIKAVNTIKIVDSKWLGYNTDSYGFFKPLESFTEEINNILIIGAGGASRAACFTLAENLEDINIFIQNRTVKKTVDLISDLKEELTKNQSVKIFEPGSNISFDLIVNTTSVGMGSLKNNYPIRLKDLRFHAKTIVYDVIYNPDRTLFLKEAIKSKIRVINGWPMLTEQGAKAFKIWTGINFPYEILENFD